MEEEIFFHQIKEKNTTAITANDITITPVCSSVQMSRAQTDTKSSITVRDAELQDAQICLDVGSPPAAAGDVCNHLQIFST